MKLPVMAKVEVKASFSILLVSGTLPSFQDKEIYVLLQNYLTHFLL